MKAFCQIHVCKYFLLINSLPFHCLNGDFWRARVLILLKSNLIFFGQHLFLSSIALVLSRRNLAYPVTSIFYIFFWKLHCLVCSPAQINFCVWYAKGVKAPFLPIWTPSCSSIILVHFLLSRVWQSDWVHVPSSSNLHLNLVSTTIYQYDPDHHIWLCVSLWPQS